MPSSQEARYKNAYLLSLWIFNHKLPETCIFTKILILKRPLTDHHNGPKEVLSFMID